MTHNARVSVSARPRAARRHLALGWALAACLAGPWAAQAAALTPTHYDMENGYGQANGGSFNYWDGSYNGAGNPAQDSSALSGGTGDLTDGVVAALNWHDVENVAGTGPYVGWRDTDPVINFFFNNAYEFQSVTIHHDDADGFGNVATPTGFRVTVGATSQLFNISDPLGAAPFSTTLNLTGLGFVGSSLSLEVIRRDSGVMLSEVTFNGVSAVPEPGSLALMVASLAALGGRRLGRKGR